MHYQKENISFKKKLFFAVFSVILFVIFLETGLRIIGYIYINVKKTNPNFFSCNILQKKDAGFTILCMGDSFTFGLGAETGYSYPDHLERLLKKQLTHKKFKVYNLGRLGSNSSMVLKSLPQTIKRYNPDIVIVMTGCNNTWVSTDNNYFVTKDNLMQKIDVGLSNLRIYKFFKALQINLKNNNFSYNDNISAVKSKEGYPGLVTDKEVNKMRNFPYIIEQCKLRLERDPENVESIVTLGHIYREIGNLELAVENYKKAIEIEPNDCNVHLQLGHTYALLKEDVLAKDEFRKAIIIGEDVDLIATYLQSIGSNMQEYTQELINLKDIVQKKCADKNKKEEAIKKLDFALAVIGNKNDLDRVLQQDLAEIIKTLRKENIDVILQTYPHEYDIATLIRAVAKKYDAPIVDNGFIFKEKLKTHSVKEFFVADGHCNAQGYQIIAENVYDSLITNKLLDKEAQ